MKLTVFHKYVCTASCRPLSSATFLGHNTRAYKQLGFSLSKLFVPFLK